MNPIEILFKEMEKHNIKTLLDINNRFTDFKGEHTGFGKAVIVEQMEKLRMADKQYDACSLWNVFWSQSADKLKMIAESLVKKVHFLFIYEEASANLDDWHNALQRVKFETILYSKTEKGSIEVWQNRLLKKPKEEPTPTVPEITVSIVPPMPEAADYEGEKDEKVEKPKRQRKKKSKRKKAEE